MAELRLELEWNGAGWTVRTGAAEHRVAAVEAFGDWWPALPDAAVRFKAPDAVLGRDLWALFAPDAPSVEPVAITISAAADDPALQLPWPLIGDIGGLVLQRPGSTLRLEIRTGAAEALTIALPVRVLFVVAASSDDPQIAAGAEYLGLLRRVRAAGVLLRHEVLLHPTRDRLENAIAAFAPQVVHWIGHGTAATLELPADDEKTITAERLATICARVPVVVLNACGGDVAAPLAAALVAHGVPIVVGMQGRVRDKACRLFTWQLYRALAAGADLPTAVSEGRRAGMVDTPGRDDWRRPALFMRAGVTLTLDDAELAAARKEATIRAAFTTPRAYFCGRFGVLDALADLRLGGRGFVDVVMLRVDEHGLLDKERDRVGGTWMLAELSGRLAAAGRVPLLFSRDDPSVEPPSCWSDLARALHRRLGVARNTLGLDVGPRALKAFAGADGDPADAAEDFTDALRADVEALHAESGRDAVILLDDLHAFGPLVRPLLELLKGAYGLGTATRPIPVILGWTETNKAEYAGPVGALKAFAGNASGTARILELARFAGDEERLAYQQFLLGQDPPLVAIDAASSAATHRFLQTLMKGVPSRLAAQRDDAHGFLCDMRWVEEADDDDVLRGPGT